MAHHPFYTPEHRKPRLRGKTVLKLCYRCGRRFTNVRSHTHLPSEFERHDDECLARAIASNSHQRPIRP